MIHIPYERIIALICEKTEKPQEEIEKLIQDKLTEFSGLLSPEGAAHIVANELKVDINQTKAEPLKISELKNGMQQIKAKVKVIAKYDMVTFERSGGEGKVQSMLVGDETGKCRLTFWHDDITLINDVQVDDVLLLDNLTVRENNNRLELHGNKKTNIERNPDGVEIEVTQATAAAVPENTPQIKLKDLEKYMNEYVTLFGVIVQVLPPYFYPVDKKTQKRVRIDDPSQFNPEEHEYNYVCNFVLDDGTDTLRVATFRDETLDLLGVSKEELLSVQEQPERFEQFAQKKLGTYCKIIGRPNKNKLYDRVEMIAQSIKVNLDPAEELKNLDK